MVGCILCNMCDLERVEEIGERKRKYRATNIKSNIG